MKILKYLDEDLISISFEDFEAEEITQSKQRFFELPNGEIKALSLLYVSLYNRTALFGLSIPKDPLEVLKEAGCVWHLDSYGCLSKVRSKVGEA